MPFTNVKKQRLLIGIDTGCNTGISVYDYDAQKLISVQTMLIHRAMEKVKNLSMNDDVLLVVVEDARKATFGRNNEADYNKAQGAGSVKRDAGIWEAFLTDLNVPFEMKRPSRNFTKITKEVFQQMTGYTGTTSQHGRDSAYLVFKRKL